VHGTQLWDFWVLQLLSAAAAAGRHRAPSNSGIVNTMSCCTMYANRLDLPESAIPKQPHHACRRGGSVTKRPSSVALEKGTSGCDSCSEASETLSWETDAESKATAASWIDVHGTEAADRCGGDVATPRGADGPSMKDQEEPATNELLAEEAWQTVGKKNGKSKGPKGKAQDCAKATKPAESKAPPKSPRDAAPLAVTKPSPGVPQQTTTTYCIDSDNDYSYQDSQDSRVPGWNRRQKASHNVKYKTKVHYQTNKRNEQCFRGF